jgi:hypothetical protein
MLLRVLIRNRRLRLKLKRRGIGCQLRYPEIERNRRYNNYSLIIRN